MIKNNVLIIITDTARYYENEKDIGVAIKDSKIKREEIFITSKLRPMDQGYK